MSNGDNIWINETDGTMTPATFSEHRIWGRAGVLVNGTLRVVQVANLVSA